MCFKKTSISYRLSQKNILYKKYRNPEYGFQKSKKKKNEK